MEVQELPKNIILRKILQECYLSEYQHVSFFKIASRNKDETKIRKILLRSYE